MGSKPNPDSKVSTVSTKSCWFSPLSERIRFRSLWCLSSKWFCEYIREPHTFLKPELKRHTCPSYFILHNHSWGCNWDTLALYVASVWLTASLQGHHTWILRFQTAWWLKGLQYNWQKEEQTSLVIGNSTQLSGKLAITQVLGKRLSLFKKYLKDGIITRRGL